MLTFISFWRAAAIVLSDLASSAYYVGGDAEKVIGKSAPWFVLAVMLFATECAPSTSSPAPCSCVAASIAWSSRPWAAPSPSSRFRRCSSTTSSPAPSAPLPLAITLPDSHGHRAPPRLRDSRSTTTVCRRLRHRGHAVLLVAEHQGATRVQRARAADHEDHDRDGRDADHLVPDHDGQAWGATAAVSVRRIDSARQRDAWLADGDMGEPICLLFC